MQPKVPKGLVFGDGDRVLDKGVWKRFKNCEHCQQIVVERAKWKDCWDSIRFCSDRCKLEAKRGRKQGSATERLKQMVNSAAEQQDPG